MGVGEGFFILLVAGDPVADHLQIVILLQGFHIFRDGKSFFSGILFAGLLVDGFFHDRTELLRREGLQKIVYRPGMEGLLHIVEILIAADNDQGNVRVIPGHGGKERQAVQDRHFHVGDHDVRMQLFDQRKTFLSVIRFADAAELIHQGRQLL